MNDDFLDKYKKRIVEELNPLMVDESLPPEERFGFYFSIASSTNQQEALEKALESAKAIEDKNQRAEALLDLLGLASELQESLYLAEENDKDSEEKKSGN